MKVVIAPDSFKGSISSNELCTVISSAIRSIDPAAHIVEVPLSDGGEGTVECLVKATNGRIVMTNATNPIGQRIEAAYGVLGDGKTIVIEAAAASGLTLVPPAERNPLTATSYGTGELIADALGRGYRNFIIGLGGSGVNDGGVGLLKALGVGFFDENGQPLPEGGGGLSRLARIDESQLNPLVHEASFTIASDVNNPLCGPNGASAIFGPQKGATPQMVQQLDASLAHFAAVVMQQKGVQMLDIVGGGAAGGLGAALVTYLNGNMKSGIETILQAVNWEEKISGANLIITGEGKLDDQTLSGKTIKGVCMSAKKHNMPIVAIAGSVQLTSAECDELGLTAAFSIVPGPASLQEAMSNTHQWVRYQTEQIYRLFYQASQSS